jgi:hypothetical protein
MIPLQVAAPESVPLKKDTVSYQPIEDHIHDEESYYVAMAASIFGVKNVPDDGVERDHAFNYHVDDHITEDEYNHSNHKCLWVTLPDSIVALTLNCCVCTQLTHQWNGDFIKTFLAIGAVPLYATFLIELKVVWALWYDNSSLADNEAFCDQDDTLQICVIFVFFLTLLGPLSDIMTEAMVGLASNRCVYDADLGQSLFLYGAGAYAGKGRMFEDLDEGMLVVKQCSTSYISWFVFWSSVAIEFSVLLLTLLVGTFYTLSQSDTSSIVQAAVAISFINEIDNMVYDVVASQSVKDFMSAVRYEIPVLKGKENNQFYKSMGQLALMTPVLGGLAYSVVVYLKDQHCYPGYLAD